MEQTWKWRHHLSTHPVWCCVSVSCLIKDRSSSETYYINLCSSQLKLGASVAQLNVGRNTAEAEQEKVLKHTHQSHLLCAELYNMLDWPLKPINLNQYFHPVSHPSCSFFFLLLAICFHYFESFLCCLCFCFLVVAACWNDLPRLLR